MHVYRYCTHLYLVCVTIKRAPKWANGHSPGCFRMGATWSRQSRSNFSCENQFRCLPQAAKQPEPTCPTPTKVARGLCVCLSVCVCAFDTCVCVANGNLPHTHTCAHATTTAWRGSAVAEHVCVSVANEKRDAREYMSSSSIF